MTVIQCAVLHNEIFINQGQNKNDSFFVCGLFCQLKLNYVLFCSKIKECFCTSCPKFTSACISSVTTPQPAQSTQCAQGSISMIRTLKIKLFFFFLNVTAHDLPLKGTLFILAAALCHSFIVDYEHSSFSSNPLLNFSVGCET